VAETRKNKRTWFDEGYGRPQGAAEQRVEYISITTGQWEATKLKRALMQLEHLAEDCELRAGYRNRAKRLNSKKRDRLVQDPNPVEVRVPSTGRGGRPRRVVRAAPVMVPPPVAFDVLVVDGSRSAGGFELGEQVFGRCRGRGDGLTHRHQVGGDVAVAEVPGCRL